MKLTIYLRSLKTARGAEQVSANIAIGLADLGYQIDFLLEEMEGRLVNRLREHRNITVIDVRSLSGAGFVDRCFQVMAIFRSVIYFRSLEHKPRKGWLIQLLRFVGKENPPLYGLCRYMKLHEPDAVLAFLNYPNIALLMSSLFCEGSTRYLVNVRNHISTSAERATSKWVRSVPNLMRLYFPLADKIIAPSIGVAHDVASVLDMADEKVTVIHNPVYREEIIMKSREPIDHRWFNDESGVPVLVAAGKFKPQKDFMFLLKAFSLLRKKRVVRLVILGEGSERAVLQQTIQQLGIAEDVDLPGYVENPYPYFRNASAFVLSSAWEGLPNVLIEAMACGCPVIATDCPSGPREILDDGRVGELVPIGDMDSMVQAIDRTITSLPSGANYMERAKQYSFRKAILGYKSELTNDQS